MMVLCITISHIFEYQDFNYVQAHLRILSGFVFDGLDGIVLMD